ncbi:MAG: endonuclease III [Clostridia bacterium]|nr:endonuclease III [Clostridia bacterium]
MNERVCPRSLEVITLRKKERALAFIEVLEKLYPDAICSLEYKDPFQLLCAVQLSAQCTDARVNLVTPALFEAFPDAPTMAKADLKEVERLIKSCGFYHNKAKNLIACANQLVDEYNNTLPDNMENLLKLAGVGRKTANLILGDVYKKGGMVIDTHAKRILYRMGLTTKQDPTQVEMETSPLIPINMQSDFCHRLVLFGRDICTARKAYCDRCPAAEFCPKNGPVK